MTWNDVVVILRFCRKRYHIKLTEARPIMSGKKRSSINKIYDNI